MGGEVPAISHIITVRATIYSYSTSSEGHNEQESTLNQLLVEMDGTLQAIHLMESMLRENPPLQPSQVSTHWRVLSCWPRPIVLIFWTRPS